MATLDWMGNLRFPASHATMIFIAADGDNYGSASEIIAHFWIEHVNSTPIDEVIESLSNAHASHQSWNFLNIYMENDEGGKYQVKLHQQTINRSPFVRNGLDFVLQRLQQVRAGMTLEIELVQIGELFYTTEDCEWVHLVALFNPDFSVPIKAERSGQIVMGLVSL